MPLIKFQNLNKYGMIRTRIIHQESTQFSFKPKGLGFFVGTQRLKYEYEHPILPPSLVEINEEKFIVPTWKKVHPKTELGDIVWEKPKVKVKIEDKEIFKFKSKSSDATYKVTKIGDTLKCNCMGYWRSKTRECTHIKQVKAKS